MEGRIKRERIKNKRPPNGWFQVTIYKTIAVKKKKLVENYLPWTSNRNKHYSKKEDDDTKY